MMPTLHDGDIVLVDLGRRTPTPPGVFVLYDGMGLLAKRVEHTSPTAIRRESASFRITRSISPMKATATKLTSSAGFAGSRGRCDVAKLAHGTLLGVTAALALL